MARAMYDEITGQYVRVTAEDATDETDATAVAQEYLNTDDAPQWVDDRGMGEFEVVFERHASSR